MLKKGNKVFNFFKQVKNELKRVKWPTRQEIKKLTFIVIGAMVVLGLYISLIDAALTKIIKWGIQ